ncbi:ROK family protein [Alicyclobacillus sp. SO9]|uniref:ROK family protein n=1 Tax=Alicyclobacillus sp. SO9 TaxID=2665646 RepID=UPI0018E80D28|nr:ROK family protein [Alicyclobacillus sp. SO9]QQE80552.1 ROK family protein [Alicyclobacillus sp. SO9]
MKEHSIGIDIGGTKIAAAVISEEGSILHRRVCPTPTAGQEFVIEKLKELIDDLLFWCQQASISVKGIGVGTAGQIDFATGRVLTGTTNIKDWNDIPLRSVLTKHSLLPVWVDNDVNVLTIAEQKFGSAVGEKNVICLSLGTGVGGGLIVDGQLVRGMFGAAAELGHISVNMNGPQCNCGFKGCLETYASGTAIARMMNERLNKTDEVQADSALTSRQVFDLYHQQHSTAIEVVNEMTEALAFAIVSLIHTFNPSVVVLGGGVMDSGTWIAELVNGKVKKLGISSMVQPVRITRTKTGVDASVIGAAYQCWLYQ